MKHIFFSKPIEIIRFKLSNRMYVLSEDPIIFGLLTEALVPECSVFYDKNGIAGYCEKEMRYYAKKQKLLIHFSQEESWLSKDLFGSKGTYKERIWTIKSVSKDKLSNFFCSNILSFCEKTNRSFVKEYIEIKDIES